jgi:hypothetical protein
MGNYEWGLGLQPDDAPAYWGARAILDLRQPKNPIDLLPDRQSGGGALFSVLGSTTTSCLRGRRSGSR